MTGTRLIGGALVAAALLGWATAALAEDAAPPADTGDAAAAAAAAANASMNDAADAAAPAAPAKPAKAAKKAKPADGSAGQWVGTAIQVGSSKGYKVVLKLSAKAAETDYPDLACSGKLTKVGAKGDSSFFVETITKGALDKATSKGCLDGTVTLLKSGDGFIWGWFGQYGGKPIVAYATLAKAAMPVAQ